MGGHPSAGQQPKGMGVGRVVAKGEGGGPGAVVRHVGRVGGMKGGQSQCGQA